ncbi:short-chain dehydrogenase/reductase SDR [Aspergillus steynii IBT 23096]|uniref:Short-chain dehydrogenase/reductase SDR n=1 Tax=Aspergillus steynii IBT 23096 TaxID=1392250 RepID=A0A2I2GKG5_9EURO|nr:short-chain dehydrogenase/reductase SDR [Aspergillus steynii IBT 23096]PLB53339.1 short-chain dehydrogenase/reductase SDR [Aspergillus steynii IBT 23096]
MSIPKPFALHGKIALVTGAGSGIGKAVAACLTQAGARTIVADVNETTGDSSACEIRRAGHDAQFIHADVTRSESVQALIHNTVITYGGLDIAVNNAGLAPDSSPICDLDEQTWDRLLSTNLTGVALCMKWQLRQMLQQGRGGMIVNMTSATTARPHCGMAAYIAAKHGLHGIRINALAPGATATYLTMSTMKALKLIESEVAAGTNVLGRMAQPDEVAQAALWLSSNASSYVTGATIAVDAGYALV